MEGEEDRVFPIRPKMLKYVHMFWDEFERTGRVPQYMGIETSTLLEAVKKDIRSPRVFIQTDAVKGLLRMFVRAYPETIPGVLDILSDDLDSRTIPLADAVVCEVEDMLEDTADPDWIDYRDPRPIIVMAEDLRRRTIESLENLLNTYLNFLDDFCMYRQTWDYGRSWYTDYMRWSTDLISVLENSHNLGWALKRFDLFEALLDVLDCNMTYNASEYNPHLPSAILRFIEDADNLVDREALFSSLGRILLNSGARQEFLRFLMRGGFFFNPDNFYRHIEFVKELLKDPDIYVRNTITYTALRILEKDAEKGAEPSMLRALIGMPGEELLNNFGSRLPFSPSYSHISLMIRMADDRKKALRNLHYIGEGWASAVLKLIDNGEVSMEEMKDSFEERGDDSLEWKLFKSIEMERDEDKRKEMKELYDRIFR